MVNKTETGVVWEINVLNTFLSFLLAQGQGKTMGAIYWQWVDIFQRLSILLLSLQYNPLLIPQPPPPPPSPRSSSDASPHIEANLLVKNKKTSRL